MMKSTLYNKKLEVIAAETAYEGLKRYRYLQQTEGTNTVENVDFQWSMNGQGYV